MEKMENCIKYVMPECSKMSFMIPRNSSSCINMLDGVAEVSKLEQLVHLESGQVLPLWPTEKLSIYSSSGCVFTVEGNHGIHKASTVTADQTSKQLFKVVQHDSAFDFFLQKGVLLHISVGDQSDVSLSSIQGMPEVLGCSLVLHKEYNLPSYSSVLVDYFSTESCALRVKGKNRRIKVSAKKEINWLLIRSIYSNFDLRRERMIPNARVGPKILVVGPRNCGKTSFCYFLLNKAFEDDLKTLYINLDICGNSNTLPGTMSIVEVDSELGITGELPDRGKTLLFGSAHHATDSMYYFLILFRLARLFEQNYKTQNTMSFSSTVVDMCGSSSEEESDGVALPRINNVIREIGIDVVVVIGKRTYYDNIATNPDFQRIDLHFIPRSENIEPRNEDFEAKIRDHAFKKYFYGTNLNPRTPCLKEVNFHDVQIYGVNHIPHRYLQHKYDFRANRLDNDEGVLNRVLGVCESLKDYNDNAVSEIKYFVCIKKVDVEREVFLILSPKPDSLLGASLLMGDPSTYILYE